MKSQKSTVLILLPIGTFALIAGTCLFLLVTFLLADTPWGVLARQQAFQQKFRELEASESKWASYDIESYSIIVEGIDHALICPPSRIGVKHDRFASFNLVDGSTIPMCKVVLESRNFTITGTFDFARRYLLANDPVHVTRVDIQFDGKYGFISDISIGAFSVPMDWIGLFPYNQQMIPTIVTLHFSEFLPDED